MDGEQAFWNGFWFAVGMNVFIVSYGFIKRLYRMLLNGPR